MRNDSESLALGVSSRPSLLARKVKAPASTIVSQKIQSTGLQSQSHRTRLCPAPRRQSATLIPCALTAVCVQCWLVSGGCPSLELPVFRRSISISQNTHLGHARESRRPSYSDFVLLSAHLSGRRCCTKLKCDGVPLPYPRSSIIFLLLAASLRCAARTNASRSV